MSLTQDGRFTDHHIRIDHGSTRVAGENRNTEKDWNVFLLNVRNTSTDAMERYALKAELLVQDSDQEVTYQNSIAVMAGLHAACEPGFPACRIITDNNELNNVAASLDTQLRFDRFHALPRPGQRVLKDGRSVMAIWLLMDAFPNWHDLGDDDSEGADERMAFARRAIVKTEFWEKLGVIAVLDMFLANTDRLAPLAVKHTLSKPSNVIFNELGPMGLDFCNTFAKEPLNDLYGAYQTDGNLAFKDWEGFFLKETLTDEDRKHFSEHRFAKAELKTSAKERKAKFSERLVAEIAHELQVDVSNADGKFARSFSSGMNKAHMRIGKWIGGGKEHPDYSPEALNLFNRLGGQIPHQLKIRYSAIWPG